MSLLFALETGWRSKCFVPAFSDVKRWKMTIKRNFIFFFQIGTSRQLSTSFIRWHRRLQARALYDKLRKLQHFGSNVEGRGQAAQENFFLGMSLGMNRDRSKRSYVWDVRWGWRRAHPIQSCDWRLTSELVGAPNVELCPGLLWAATPLVWQPGPRGCLRTPSESQPKAVRSANLSTGVVFTPRLHLGWLPRQQAILKAQAALDLKD